jgi:hypothetical protein
VLKALLNISNAIPNRPLMWRIWRKYNAKKFKECERMMKDLKAFMFKFLYH